MATVSIGGAKNAGLLAARILASGVDDEANALRVRLDSYREDLYTQARDKGRALTQKLEDAQKESHV